MTVRYVNWEKADDTGDGLSYANAKKTLNGVENTPVAAGDIIYVRPGTYRELLTCDVAGNAGNPVTYIGDVSGEHTDGVGGAVRVTGSNDDLAETRSECITGAVAYRTFRGFSFDICSNSPIVIANTDHWIVEDCFFQNGHYSSIYSSGLSQSTHTVRRCIFIASGSNGVKFDHTAQVVASGHLVEDCLFIGCSTSGVLSHYVEGVTVKNCTFVGCYSGVWADISTAATQVTVNNCIFTGCSLPLRAANVDEIAENYNTLYKNVTDRTNTNTGANSNAYPPQFNYPILLATMKYPYSMFSLSPDSQIRGIAGTGESTVDLYGMSRPATASKNSWGAVQFSDTLREVTTKRTGTASIKFEDAGRHQIFVPTTNVSTTISVYVYREADYAGTNPQMIIRQPGVAARTTTDAGAASGWNLLTDTFTPAASPPYVIVELVSNNTNTANPTTNDVFFDDLVVS